MISRRALFTGLLLAVPAAHAQRFGRDRFEIIIINNWDATVHVTIAAERRDEVVRENWTIAPRARTALLHRDHRPIRVRDTDRIKIRDDMRSVRIGDVARFDNGRWIISVRDVVRAQRERERDRRF